jgi:hypothetical protein
VVLEGLPLEQASRDEVGDLRALARETDAEVWLSVACAEERVRELPSRLARLADLFSVVLALEPGPGTVTLRALKDHDNPDCAALHVALDPKSLLLVRS